ncbi:putative iron-sulfur cluster-binding metallochaperone [Cyanobacterium aponinum]|uniref:CopZ zinc binding domain-containing protein n=1 Tax=Cyanobacterium aponinum (strain PCC 10605) TaxID=755178 RepID=K9Z7C1_CYAAP|nr:copper chaperone Copz family protein [Cyanobacterium aponinum]AFZ54637.1 hypothetical protein Cyan10605_2557 [Cyanobacterium aponinum PCC 10605]
MSNCFVCQQKGKPVKIVTLQNLLKTEVLAKLNTTLNYFFCGEENCPIVYFNQQGQIFIIEELKVPVYQKDKSKNIPVCYCFNWTRESIYQKIKETQQNDVENSIKAKMKAQLCACEIKNPQGSCCLTNVHQTIDNYSSEFELLNDDEMIVLTQN